MGVCEEAGRVKRKPASELSFVRLRESIYCLFQLPQADIICLWKGVSR